MSLLAWAYFAVSYSFRTQFFYKFLKSFQISINGYFFVFLQNWDTLFVYNATKGMRELWSKILSSSEI